ncbi:MAG: hypothetical protein H6720_01625 [Sandaracinus sp.]|nr:hypothetical protein [Sandaracinus sp.]
MSRVIARDDAPDWRHVNYAPPRSLTAVARCDWKATATRVRPPHARAAARATAASKQRAPFGYNLACVSPVRGRGSLERRSRRCAAGDLRVHNLRSREADTDLEPL